MKIIQEYKNKRDEAIKSNNIEKYKDFLKWAEDTGAQPKGQYQKFIKSPEAVQLATIHKMACNITTMPKDRVAIAKKWLKVHNMTPKIF